MAGTAGQHKQVPDTMMKRDLFRGKENNACRIKQTAGQDHGQQAGRRLEQHGFDGHHGQPAHEKIQGEREALGFLETGHVQDNAHNRQSPDNAKQGPTPHASQVNKGDRRITAGDQQVNRGMIQNSENTSGFTGACTVVDCRANIENDQRQAIDAIADDTPDIALANRNCHKGHEAGQAKQDAGPMRDAVENRFAECIENGRRILLQGSRITALAELGDHF